MSVFSLWSLFQNNPPSDSLALVLLALLCLFSVMHLENTSWQVDKGSSTQFFYILVSFILAWLYIRMVSAPSSRMSSLLPVYWHLLKEVK